MPSDRRVEPKDLDDDPVRTAINADTEDVEPQVQNLEIDEYFLVAEDIFQNRGVEDRHPTPEAYVLAELATAVGRADLDEDLNDDDDEVGDHDVAAPESEEDNWENGGAMVAAGFEGWQLHNQYNLPNAPQQIFADEIDIAMANRHRVGRLGAGANNGQVAGSSSNAEERGNLLRDLVQEEEEGQMEEVAGNQSGIEDENGNEIEIENRNIPTLKDNSDVQEDLDFQTMSLDDIIAINMMNDENIDEDYDVPS